jgi:single-strand DNA-binding protein
MASFNRVVLVGNRTRDPEKVRYLASGTAVTDIGLAVNDRVKKGNEWVDEATFVDITLWGRTAEVACEYLTKGAPVLIEGRLKYEQWETNDGQKRSKLKVVGEKMQMLGGKGGGGGGGGGGGQRGGSRRQADDGSDYGNEPSPSASHSGPPDEDIPF